MAVGQGAYTGYGSYLAVGRESALGTYTTCTAGLDFISGGFQTVKEVKILEQIETRRAFSKTVKLGKTTTGEFEFYPYAESAGLVYFLQNALGGTLTSATTTGETVGAASFEHTINFGDMDQGYKSLCFNMRYGDSSGGFVYQYNGARVNELMFNAELGDALKANISLIAFDSTKTSNDVASVLNVAQNEPLSFVNGRLSIESTFASLTSSSFWHVQSVEFGIANNLQGDESARRIGSDIITVLPPGIANMTLNFTVRWDTTTAYDALMNGTNLAAELEFTGSTLTGSKFTRSLKVQFPKILIAEAPKPEVGDPSGILQSEVVCHVLRDDSSNTGYAMRAIVRNLTSSYA